MLPILMQVILTNYWIMEKYVFLIDYQVGTLIMANVIEAKDEQDAILKGFEMVDFPYIGEKTRGKIISQVKSGEEYPVVIRGISEVKNFFLFPNGKALEMNYMKIHNSIDGGKSCFLLFTFYKGGIFISKSKEVDLFQVLPHWARYLSWRYYSKEDRAAIRGVISKAPSLNEVIDGVVWNFETQILGNSLKVYIVRL